MDEEDHTETMTIREAARLIDWLRAAGINDTDICNCLKYIATGSGLPVEKEVCN